MSREILFRGKRKDNGEWVYGDLIVERFGNTPHIHWFEYSSCVLDRQIEVITETVGQFTGLTDKNGKKLFEGDIVKTKYGRLCFVEWRSTPCFYGFDLSVFANWNTLDKAPSGWDLYVPENLEVVGNIHDNAELLGENK